MQAATQVVDATGAPIEWDWVDQQPTPNTLPSAAVKSLKRTGVGLTGFFAVRTWPGRSVLATPYTWGLTFTWPCMLFDRGARVAAIGPNTAMSANVRLYRELDLYANVVHSFEVPGTPPPPAAAQPRPQPAPSCSWPGLYLLARGVLTS